MSLMPRIADWVRTRGGTPGEVVAARGSSLSTGCIIEDLKTSDLDPPAGADVSRAANWWWSPGSPTRGSASSAWSRADRRRGPHPPQRDRRATRVSPPNATVIAQHALILLTALAGLVARGSRPRERPRGRPASPALRAYEEAMSRLRLRDDERLAAFDREKNALTSVLRDRETMARAGELTAGIVHEVRNSMGAIAAQAKMLEKSDDERVRGSAVGHRG